MAKLKINPKRNWNYRHLSIKKIKKKKRTVFPDIIDNYLLLTSSDISSGRVYTNLHNLGNQAKYEVKTLNLHQK